MKLNIHHGQVIFQDFPARMTNSKPLYIQLCTVGLVKHAIQFLSLSLRDTTDFLSFFRLLFLLACKNF